MDDNLFIDYDDFGLFEVFGVYEVDYFEVVKDMYVENYDWGNYVL